MSQQSLHRKFLIGAAPHIASYLPEGVADGAVPLHSNGEGEVDRPREPHLGHGQEHGDHPQVGGVGPERGKEAGYAEDGDGQTDVNEVKSRKSKHEMVEVLEDDLT